MNEPQTDLQSCIQNCEAEFIHVIMTRLGIIMHSHNKDLKNTIMNACHKFHCDPQAYLEMIITCDDNSPMLEHLIANVTVGETYFFRDKQQMALLKSSILPQIIHKKREQNNLSLRVWSAGCASGEEIYTIAILLDELLPDIKDWKITLLGTDINTEGLRKAKSARYNKWSMRSISNHYKKNYFTEQDDQYHLSKQIMERVNFSYLNLNDNNYPTIANGTNSQDLIICRNVLIYFNSESITRLMKKISLSLVNGGFLLLGASDPVNLEDTNLVFHHNQGMLFSRQDDKHHLIKKLPDSWVKAPPFKTSSTTKRMLLSTTNVHLKPKSSENAQKNPQINLNAKAKAAADSGQLDEAVAHCKESLLLDSTDKNTYFILGLTLQELNRLDEAEQAFRKTLYLDHRFVEGHFQLGLLLLKRNQHKEGLKSLQNALTIVNTNDSSQIVPESQGLTYGHFAKILHAEIELYAMAGSLDNEKQKK